ncbi:hypothetical protein JOC76_001877 [Neobacillus cucumis]|nr:hypothetical protein [Neobacillus cucumis]
MVRIRTQPRSFGPTLSEIGLSSHTTSLFWFYLV